MYIINKLQEKMAVQYYFAHTGSDKKSAFAIIAHGLAGYKEEEMLQCVKNIFLKNGISVLMYDARFSLGDSDGPLENACFSHFIEDLNTVIQWAKKQSFYTNPFYLCGHSLGAGACLHYAINNPQDVAGIVTLSAVYNGIFLKQSYLQNKPDFMQEWQEKQYLNRVHPNNPQKHGKISYTHLADACQYQLEKSADKIMSPTLIVCGDVDISSTIDHNMILKNAIGNNARLTIIKSCGHTYKTQQNQTDLKEQIDLFLTDVLTDKKIHA